MFINSFKCYGDNSRLVDCSLYAPQLGVLFIAANSILYNISNGRVKESNNGKEKEVENYKKNMIAN